MKRILLNLVMVLLLVNVAWAQERTVTGKVTSSEDGSGLPGVNVVIKGTTTGTTTDIEGNFRLSVPEGTVLLFSAVGMKGQEVAVGARSVIDLSMDADIKELSEVVVTGYGSASTKNLVSSVSTVGSSAIQNVPMPDINQIIQGRAAGVLSSAPSGQPGAAQQIRIRGSGSITAGNGPLYVIDGVIMQNGDLAREAESTDLLSNINPNDIESLTILKDASATALYGSRGANGVILINTKKGKAGGTSIVARGQYGVTQPNIGNFELMNGKQVYDYERAILANSGSSEATIDAVYPSTLLDNTFNWVDAAFRTGKTSNYELQASGGDQKTRFFVSGGVFNQEGILIESGFKRYSVRSNIDHNFNDRLDMTLNMNVSYTDQLNATAGNRFASPLLGSFSTTPLQGAYDPETGKLYTGLEAEYRGFTGDNFLYSAPKNPVNNNNLRAIGKFSLGYKIMDNLRLSQTLSNDFVNVREKAYFDPTTADGFTVGGEIDEAFNQNLVLTSQTQLTGNWTFGEKHNVDALAVYEFQSAKQSGFYAYGTGLASPKLVTLNSTAIPQDVGGEDTEYSFLSYLGQINYNYDNKYFFTSSVRRDGSSRFGANNRYANFWSVGGSWRAIEEDFISDNLSFLSDLKLRASYGITGNADINNFGSLGLYGFGPAYNGVPGSSPVQVSNPDLTWEKNKSSNIGLNLGFLTNKITLAVDVYRRISEDLLQNVPISATSGFTTALRNIGSVRNQGVEVQVSTVNFEGDFSWTTDFNMSANRNKVLSLYNGNETNTTLYTLREGENLNTFFLRRWAGVNPADGSPLWLTENGETTSSYNSADQVIVGKADPDFVGGLNNTFSYKGLSVSAFFYFAVGHEIYNQSRAFIESDGSRIGWNHLADMDENRWKEPGDIAKYPRPLVGGNSNSNGLSTRYLEDGSFLRLRNLTIGYTLPSNWLKPIGLKSVRVYGQGQNLLTFTKYSGFDPEMTVNGNEFFRYPVGKVFTGGIEISL